MIPMLIGAGLGIAGAVGKMIGRGKANKTMRELQKQNPIYAENPLAAQRLALAQNLFNSRMPGASMMERNIYGGMGNTLSNAQRNATDASQLLSVGAASQGQAQQGFENLQQMELSDQQRRYQNLSGAQEGLINEQDKVFGDQLRRYGNDVQFQGAINENRQNNWGDLSNMGFGAASFGLQGGFDGLKEMFGGGANNMQFTPFNQNQMGINQYGLGMAMANLPKPKKSPYQ